MRTAIIFAIALSVFPFMASDVVAATQNMALLGQGGGLCGGVVISGHFAYVVEYAAFNVLDITDPTAPVTRGRLLMPSGRGNIGRMAVAGNRVYVPWSLGLMDDNTTLSGGFQIVDVSNPDAPRFLGAYTAPGAVLSVAVANNVAYVPWALADFNSMAFSGGLQVVDVSNPAAPALSGQCDTNASLSVALANGKAYLGGFGGMAVVDISTPSAPAVVGRYNGDLISAGWDVAVSGGMAYLYMCYGLYSNEMTYVLNVLDLTNPAQPVLRGSCQLAASAPVFAGSVVLNGHYAYVANNLAGLQIVDVSNTASPLLVSSCLPPHEALAVAVSGTTAYVANSDAGLGIVNVSDPANPFFVRSCLAGAPYSGAVRNGYLYTIWNCSSSFPSQPWGGMRVLKTPAMVPVAGLDAPGDPFDLAVASDRAYVSWDNYAAGSSGVEIYGVNDPVHPARLGTYTGQASGIGAAGNFLYAGRSSGGPIDAGFEIVDVTDPTDPQDVKFIDIHNPYNIFVAGVDNNKLCVFNSFTSLIDVLFYNVSSAQNPQCVAEFGTASQEVSLSGNVCFAGGYNGTMLYVEDQDYMPNPIYDAGQRLTAIKAVGRLAYLGAPGGIQVIDLIDPLAPKLVGAYDYALSSAKIQYENGVVYAVDGVAGTFALRYTGALSSDLAAKFDAQWADLRGLLGLGPEPVDVNGDGLPEAWALALVQAVMDNPTAPYHDAVCTAYINNVVALSQESSEIVATHRECLAALLTMGADLRGYFIGELGLTGGPAGLGVYMVATNPQNPADEPLSGDGDIDHRGVTNAQLYANMIRWGGSAAQYPQQALDPMFTGVGPVPSLSALGLLATIAACLAAGIAIIAARTRNAR